MCIRDSTNTTLVLCQHVIFCYTRAMGPSDFFLRPKREFIAWQKEQSRLREEVWKRRFTPPENKASYVRFVSYVRTTKRLRCYWCKKWTKRGTTRHIDHIQPVTEGGTNCIFNLCVACRRCNIREKDKLPIEFCGQGELHFW